MEIILLMIMFISVILLSIILNHYFPYLSMPLIQIGLGFLIGLTNIGSGVVIDTELIMVIIIAPLVYNEARNFNTTQLYAQRKDVLILAFPMVLITVLLLGYFFQFSLPILSLAACFALAAALAPTDVLTVASLSNRMVFPEKDKVLLEGEGLINDASGITAFQIALIALATGDFSFAMAIEKLFYISIVGIVAGLVINWIKNKIVTALRRNGIEDTNFYLIIDFLLPFIGYMAADLIGASGVLAVVTIGLLEAMTIKKNTLFDAKLNNVSTTTWQVIETILNSFIFIYLGVQIPIIFNEVTDFYNGNITWLFGLTIIITIVLYVIRFFLFILYHFYKNGFKKKIDFKEQLVLTLSGVKGTVTLATITSLPLVIGNQPFDMRYLLIFIAAAVIVISILFAIIFLPLLLDKKEESSNDIEIVISKEVIKLLKQEKNKENTKAINAVIKSYQDKIKRIAYENNGLPLKEQRKLDKKILFQTINIEYAEIDKLLEEGTINQNDYDFYERFLRNFLRNSKKMFSYRISPRHIVFRLILPLRRKIKKNRNVISQEKIAEKQEMMREIFIHNRIQVIESIKKLKNEENEKYLAFKIKDEERLIELIEHNQSINQLPVNLTSKYNDEMEKGFQFERNCIQEHYEKGDIDRDLAAELKQNVNVMEEYYLMDTESNLAYHFMNNFFEREEKRQPNLIKTTKKID